jgi:hypothetical protein
LVVSKVPIYVIPLFGNAVFFDFILNGFVHGHIESLLPLEFSIRGFGESTLLCRMLIACMQHFSQWTACRQTLRRFCVFITMLSKNKIVCIDIKLGLNNVYCTNDLFVINES